MEPHERALVARANMLAYELTDHKTYATNARKIGKEILRDILTKESYIPEESELKLLFFLDRQGTIEIDEAQIERLLFLFFWCVHFLINRYKPKDSKTA